MNPSVDKRISSEDMLTALQNIASGTFILPNAVQQSSQAVATPGYLDAVQQSSQAVALPGYLDHLAPSTTAKTDNESKPTRPSYMHAAQLGGSGGPTKVAPVTKEVPDSKLLMDALNEETPAALATLLKRGVDVCGWRDANGQTLLHLATQRGKVEMINFLCDHGADVNAKDFDGKPPVYYAAKFKSVQAGRILIAHGADLEVEASSGKPLLAYDEEDMGIYYLEDDHYKESKISFLDDNKLLIGVAKEQIDPVLTAWYHNQATTLEFMSATPGVSNEAKQKLALLSLQAYDKAAAHGFMFSKKLQFQMSPLFPNDFRYHRSTGSQMIDLAEAAFSNTGLFTLNSAVRLVHSPLVSEVIARSCPKDSKVITVSGPEDLQEIAAELRANKTRDETNPLIIDYSGFVAKNGGGVDARQII